MGARILMIDNYDSFTYNLVHYLEELGAAVTVRRNDRLGLDEASGYDGIVLSPGPGIPEEAGILKALIARYAGEVPILGVCLGQQAIGEVFGGSLRNLEEVYHGRATEVERLEDDPLFKGIPERFTVGRYHSWVVADALPAPLEVLARDAQGQIMAIRHREFDVKAVQFHPESVLTPEGKMMLANWLQSSPGGPTQTQKNERRIEPAQPA